MKIIFLDIDGVVCTLRSHLSVGDFALTRKLDPVVLGLIDRLLEVDPENTRVVISSSRRRHHTKEKLLGQFRAEGFAGQFHDDWRTPSLPSNFRGDEIRAYLANHPDVTAYVILDDERDFYPDQPLVRTDASDGMLFNHFLAASKLLHGDEEAWFDMKRANASAALAAKLTLPPGSSMGICPDP